MTDLLIELPDTSVVRRSSVILVVTSELGVEGFLLLVHRLVSVLLAPFGDCRQAPFKPFLHRSHVHGELPLSTACAYVREAEDVQSAGFLPLPLRIGLCIPPEFHQSRLLRVERQTVFCEPLRYDLHHPVCVLLVLEAQYGIIGESDLVRLPPQSGLHFILEPFVENIVQVDVSQERADRLPLSRTCFAHEQPAFFDDPSLYPLPYQPEHASIADSLLDHFHELLPHDRIEVCSDI